MTRRPTSRPYPEICTHNSVCPSFLHDHAGPRPVGSYSALPPVSASKPTPEAPPPKGPRSGWPIPPVRSDLVGEADKLLAATQPARPTPPPTPPTFSTEKQLTAPADCPVRDPAHAIVFTTAVVTCGARSVHLRTGMRAAHTLPGDRNRAGSPPATDSRQNPAPASPAIQTRCFAYYDPAWRSEAGADTAERAGRVSTWVAGPSRYESSIHDNPAGSYRRAGRCKMILKEP